MQTLSFLWQQKINIEINKHVNMKSETKGHLDHNQGRSWKEGGWASGTTAPPAKINISNIKRLSAFNKF
jgi:hypothetical protein